MSPRRLLLVGIDGLRISDALSGSDAPALQQLVTDGSYVDLKMEVPTISGPGWTSLLTGTTHLQHGVFDNSFVGHRIAPESDILSRIHARRPTATTFAASGWAPLTDPDGPGPVLDPRRDDQRVGLHRVVVRDGETYGYRRADAEVTATAVHAVLDGGVEASFVYLGEADEAAHLYGGISDEYRESIRRIDAHLARLLHAVRSRASTLDEEWLVVVTTDHGHLDEGGHGGDETIVRASFLSITLLTARGAENIMLPAVLAPHQVGNFILETLS